MFTDYLSVKTLLNLIIINKNVDFIYFRQNTYYKRVVHRYKK